MNDLDLTCRDRLLLTAGRAAALTPPADSPLRSVALTDPAAVAQAVREFLGGATTVVTGTLDRRLVLIDTGAEWIAADLSGRSHRSRPWPNWTHGHLAMAEPFNWLTTMTVTDEGRRRLLRPRTLLASLYHPEFFPMPRFPLAISDLARAARATLLGHVELMDMQFGSTVADIADRVTHGEIDVLGVSATFGQHDLMMELLGQVTAMDTPPMIVAGGSLTVRNERLLLDRYPDLIIGRGAGESTIADVLAHWHGDLPLRGIRGAGHRDSARGAGTTTIGVRRNAVVTNRDQGDIWPELDLLDTTFRHGGVAQLESSRGCTNYCSFCPRGHKGQWAGSDIETLPWIVGEIAAVFDRHPDCSRTLYLVDEEFIGRGPNAVPRALAVADILAEHNLAWETSCRVDQVVDPTHSRDWHLDRADLWRGLVERGLRRCLFGVESGVTSILDRFNKETTSHQNALAIRTLTALGVPPRFTYITFDQLMTPAELRATYEFQGRTDLLIHPQPGLAVADIVDGVRDESWVAAHTTGLPFHTAISYMLVSMECLIGAAYTHRASAAGLTDGPDPAMGRVHARFADWRIGGLSRWAQLWIDRNFALDYTLKSLEKVLDGIAYHRVRAVRRLLKNTAYSFLGAMITLLEATSTDAAPGMLDDCCRAIADILLDRLRDRMRTAISVLDDDLPAEQLTILRREHATWERLDTWRLINAVDPCGT